MPDITLAQQMAVCEVSATPTIFIDWDDTILCSSFLSASGYRVDDDRPRSEELDAQLKALELSAISVITIAKETGRVFIVTNADQGWVEMSAKKWLPGILPILSTIQIFSARYNFERLHPGSPVAWKICAFRSLLNHCGVPTHVLSFGDSNVEREAIHLSTREIAHCRTKSIKFADRPSIEKLRCQLELVRACFQSLVLHPGVLDLVLTISDPPSEEKSRGEERQ